MFYSQTTLKFIRYKSVNILIKNLGNIDKVPVSFDLPQKYTIDERGSEDISIATTGIKFFNFFFVIGSEKIYCIVYDNKW